MRILGREEQNQSHMQEPSVTETRSLLHMGASRLALPPLCSGLVGNGDNPLQGYKAKANPSFLLSFLAVSLSLFQS